MHLNKIRLVIIFSMLCLQFPFYGVNKTLKTSYINFPQNSWRNDKRAERDSKLTQKQFQKSTIWIFQTQSQEQSQFYMLLYSLQNRTFLELFNQYPTWKNQIGNKLVVSVEMFDSQIVKKVVVLFIFTFNVAEFLQLENIERRSHWTNRPSLKVWKEI